MGFMTLLTDVLTEGSVKPLEKKFAGIFYEVNQSIDVTIKMTDQTVSKLEHSVKQVDAVAKSLESVVIKRREKP